MPQTNAQTNGHTSAFVHAFPLSLTRTLTHTLTFIHATTPPLLQTAASSFEYTLRFDSTPGGYDVSAQFANRWMTGFSFPDFQVFGPRDDSDVLNPRFGSQPGYAQYGFTQAQHAINLSVSHQRATLHRDDGCVL